MTPELPDPEVASVSNVKQTVPGEACPDWRYNSGEDRWDGVDSDGLLRFTAWAVDASRRDIRGITVSPCKVCGTPVTDGTLHISYHIRRGDLTWQPWLYCPIDEIGECSLATPLTVVFTCGHAAVNPRRR
jgi:hypothetical protein